MDKLDDKRQFIFSFVLHRFFFYFLIFVIFESVGAPWEHGKYPHRKGGDGFVWREGKGKFRRKGRDRDTGGGRDMGIGVGIGVFSFLNKGRKSWKNMGEGMRWEEGYEGIGRIEGGVYGKGEGRREKGNWGRGYEDWKGSVCLWP